MKLSHFLFFVFVLISLCKYSAIACDVTGNSVACVGDTCVYSAQNNENCESSWIVLGGEIISQTSSEISVIWNSIGLNSVAFDTSEIEVEVFSSPAVRVVGYISACIYTESSFYCVTKDKDLNLQWDVSNGVILSGQGSDTINVLWNYSGTGRVTLIAENANGCRDTADHYLTISATLSPTMYGNAIACVDFMEDYFTDKQSILSYKWSATNAHFIGPDNISEVSIIWDQVGPQDLTLKVTHNGTGCTATYTKPIYVSYVPEVYIGKLPEICLSSKDFELFGGIPEGGYYDGDWVTNGHFMTSIAGTGEHEITYNFMNTSGCVGSDTTILIVRTTPQTPKIKFEDNLLTALTNADEFFWYLDGERIPGGAGKTWKPLQTGTYTATAGNIYGCISPHSNKISIDMATIEDIPDGISIILDDNGILNITSNDIIGQYRLFDMLGKEISGGTIGTDSFNTSIGNFGKVYFLFLYSPNGFLQHKIKIFG